MYGERLLGYELDAEQAVNIDGWADWERAERLLQRHEREAQAVTRTADASVRSVGNEDD